MKSRDKWITVAFLLFILTIPLVTVARNILPDRQQEGLTEEEKAILEENGTIITDKESQSGDQAGDVKKDTGFAALHCFFLFFCKDFYLFDCVFLFFFKDL